MTTASEYRPSDEAVAVLQAGLAWLYDVDQPAGAITSHHGVSCRAADRTFNFVPSGAKDLPVIVVNVAAPVWVGTVRHKLTNPLCPGELAVWSTLLRTLGHDVRETWNGAGETGSIGLARRAAPSLLAALSRYRHGCHGHDGHKGTVFCAEWYSEGHAQLVPPAWPMPRPVTA